MGQIKNIKLHIVTDIKVKAANANMWIKIRTMDGKKSFQVDGLSKLTKIEELRERLEKDLEVPPPRQRLFFAGRQLEDGSTLFDYHVERNSLIQVMIRPVMTPELDEDKENKEN